MRSRLGLVAALLGLAAVAGGAVWLAARATPDAGRPAGEPALSVADALSDGPLDGFARATAPRALEFPRDHGPHPEFRTEWWYYTGNLRSADGREFGFQLTFFRTALAPRASAPAPTRASAWATSQVYLGHFALTDVRARQFRAWSRAGREALGLAGARGEPYRVWVDTWRAEANGVDANRVDAGRSQSEPPLPPGERGQGARGTSITPWKEPPNPSKEPAPAIRLHAAEGNTAIDLILEAGKPVVLQGDAGLSQKGPEPGNASYYYSLTRMPARGGVQIGDERVPVEGQAWMDHEWSTSALSPDLAGWDWFALQLDDGRDLMLYRLRRRDGAASPFSAGTLVEGDGRIQRLAAGDVAVEALGRWTSPRTGTTYPAGWRISWPAGDLVVELMPKIADQELDVGLRYWEGAVSARGTARGRAVGGQGYVELVGYAPVSGRRGSAR